MTTLYDLVTMVIFSGLVVLFLQRSTASEPTQDRMYQYLPPSLGCALANYLGNHHQDGIAIASLVAVVIYVFVVLKPFKSAP